MHRETLFDPTGPWGRLGSMIIALIRFPFELMIAILQWLATAVLGRLLALPGLLLIAAIGEVRLARIRIENRVQTRAAILELRREIGARQTTFREILIAIDRADREHAQLDPHFEESLVAAEEAYRQRLQSLIALARATNGLD